MRDINCGWMGKSAALEPRQVAKELSVPPELLVPLTNLAVTPTPLSFGPENFSCTNGIDLPTMTTPSMLQVQQAMLAGPAQSTKPGPVAVRNLF